MKMTKRKNSVQFQDSCSPPDRITFMRLDWGQGVAIEAHVPGEYMLHNLTHQQIRELRKWLEENG